MNIIKVVEGRNDKEEEDRSLRERILNGSNLNLTGRDKP